MTPIRAVISDFGGVLTSPLLEAFAAFHRDEGIPRAALGRALAAAAEREGVNPLYELECGRMTEREFLDRLAAELRADLGRDIDLHGFAERYFAMLRVNEPMIAFLDRLRERGLRLALLTNNVREWEPRWRAMLPVDELFAVVVDSAFAGMRKPDPGIFELTCARLGVEPGACVFVDDNEINCAAARALGMTAVWFRSTEQAIAEIEAALDGRPAVGGSPAG